jgi:hypothetical protein
MTQSNENEQTQPSENSQPIAKELIEKRGGLTGSGQLMRDPIVAQPLQIVDIAPAGAPVNQTNSHDSQTKDNSGNE